MELTTFSEPATAVDRFKQLGAAGWMRRQTKKALKRLRMIFEEPPSGELKRATIAGYEPAKAPRFGGPAGYGSRPRAASRGLLECRARWLRRLALIAMPARPRRAGAHGLRRRGAGRGRAGARGARHRAGGGRVHVFITRELNPDIQPDKAYVTDEAQPGETIYGVFLQACNNSDEEAAETASSS